MVKSKKVTICIVTYNSKQYMETLLSSIYNQTFRDFNTLIVDNYSHDETVEYVRKNYPFVGVLANRRNLGFAVANNQGIKLSSSEYILFCNDDVILEPDCLEEMVKVMDKNPKLGSVGAKLLKVKKTIEDELEEIEKTKMIDSVGLEILKNRRFIERGVGETDGPKFAHPEKVFGFSGAFVMYRKKALEEAKINEEYFDEDFFMYKEDVDLAWRVKHLGWEAEYSPDAIAYHFRSASDPQRQMGPLKVLKNRKNKSNIANFHSYKNHLSVLVKNESTKTFLQHSPRILFYEFQKLVYLLFINPKGIASIYSFLKILPKMLKKRKLILKNSKIPNNELFKWIS